MLVLEPIFEGGTPSICPLWIGAAVLLKSCSVHWR
jgi:hypothetical protein